MRVRVAALSLLAAALTGCTGASRATLGTEAGLAFSVRHLPVSPASPSALLEIHAGSVMGVVPDSWETRPLLDDRYPQEGFVASPRLSDWDSGTGEARGVEIFWIDVSKLQIPSDYYYLVARGAALRSLSANTSCHAAGHRVFADHPPDFTGRRFSPGDYVESGTGTCQTETGPTRWAYVVAAPGFGPAREVGLPTSGLYVVIAVVSGAKSKLLLDEIMQGARFGNVPITRIVSAAATSPR